MSAASRRVVVGALLALLAQAAAASAQEPGAAREASETQGLDGDTDDAAQSDPSAEPGAAEERASLPTEEADGSDPARLVTAEDGETRANGGDERAGLEVEAAGAAGDTEGDAPNDRGTDPGWLIAAGAVTGLAVSFGVAALISWTYREGHVARFNSDECVSPTMSRAELCYDSAYRPGQQAEVTTAVAGATAGAAAIAALVLFLAAPPRPPADEGNLAWSCGAGPGAVGVACGARF